MSLLEVRDLTVEFPTDAGPLRAVDGVSFDIEAGTTTGLVGESGCGKSVTALTLLGLTRDAAARIGGSANLGGRDLIAMTNEELREVRGSEIAMISQDPLSALNPYFTIGNQLAEALAAHRSLDDAAQAARVVELLELVRIPDARGRLGTYPHELSGGMRQRVMIAMALANEPSLLIADEPTTALDVTTQAQILRLLDRLQDELGMATVLITHDLGVVAQIAERVLVMYAGEIVEAGTLEQIFYDPQHPYTWGLLGSVMRLDRPRRARLAQIKGQPPSLVSPPEGCRFRPRCPHEFDRCPKHPPLEPRSGDADHVDRCWLEPDVKRARRTMSSGDIGLEAA